MAKFRFQDLEIWQDAIDIAQHLLDIADGLEEAKKFRFAEQLRGAALSISNNIAEGSGSVSRKEFFNFLNIARHSIFENANILILLEKRKLVQEKTMNELLEGLDLLSRRITQFQRSL